ncbi:hypothetical protein [Jannaschia donghaensis]|uniref:Uncharacterized protein n=1 Tax=Jannaschia donghaensis TaxID=420998 RepID=A0A0M6YH42_9RHOB|nr:hypothetical protein [Jannaschia donghaensis]CTQ49270.1 hypothetical protein JDO7802_01283 [Jannaschia donghaensis]
MDDFKKTNRAGRGIAMLFANVGWGIAAVGFLLAAAGFMLGATPGSVDAPGPITWTGRLVASAPGVGLALFGLFSVLMAAQTRAALDTADIMRAMLLQARRAKPAAPVVRSADPVEPAVAPMPAAPPPAPAPVPASDDVPPMPPNLRPRVAPVTPQPAQPPAKPTTRSEPVLKSTSKSGEGPRPHPIFSAKPPR